MRIKRLLSSFEYLIYFFSITIVVQALSSFMKGIYVNYKYNGDIILAEGSSALLRESKWIVYIISYVVILFLFFYMRSKSNDGREIIKLARLNLREIVPIIIMGIAEVVFFGYLLTFIKGNMVDTYHIKTETLIEGNVGIRFMAQVLFAPIVEEIVFRGCMLERFRKIMPTALAVILSSLMFGIVHGGGIHFIYTAMSGCIMAFVAIWTKSILAPILQHMAFNFVGAFHNMQILDEVSNGILCVVGLVCIVVSMIYLYFVSNKKNEQNC